MNWISNYSADPNQGKKSAEKKDEVEAKDLDVISKRGSMMIVNEYSEKKSRNSDESTIPPEVVNFF